MKLPANLLSLLIEHDAFRVCRIMPESEFIRFCEDRKVRIDRQRLRQLDRIGVFRPFLRAYKPEVTFKIEAGEEWRGYGDELQEGEVWEGETVTEIVAFDPITQIAADWHDEGLLWVPGQGLWKHEASIDSDPDRHEAYYSRYQLYRLEQVVALLTLSVQLEWAVNPDGSFNKAWNPRLRKRAGEWAHHAAGSLRDTDEGNPVAALLQLLGNRFYYKTRSDGRQITVGQFHDWNWGDYARSWSAGPLLAAFGLTKEESRNLYERLDIAWTHADPISAWYPLARFVRVQKRERLKGDALRALVFREMAHMCRLFHQEAFGEDLRPLGEVGVQIIKRIPDVNPDRDPMRALELTANDFGVNGKPQLVLFVEGQTEQATLPIIFDRLWGSPASRYGIEFSSLGGVDNAAGGKEAPFSALWRLVDYLHHHQTLAFVLLDNEGFASRNVALGLPRANSVHSSDRKATRPDHIKIWRTSFELENFSDTEISEAMNIVAGRKIFLRSDVKACREAALKGTSRGQKLRTIDRLFKDRTGKPLEKPRLAEVLAELMFDPRTRRRPENRPITKFLIRVARKAALNFQPITEADWLRNQRSGYLGILQAPARRDRKRRLERRRRQRTRRG